MAENPHTDAHYARVGIYSPALWSLIRPVQLPLPLPLPPHAHAQNQASKDFWTAQARAHAAQTWADAEHGYHAVGSTVEITGVHHKKYTPFLNCQGVVRRTVARGSDFKFFVLVQRNARGEPVDSAAQIADLNRRTLDFLRPDERGLLPCKTTHMRRIWQMDHPPAPAATHTHVPPPTHTHTHAPPPTLTPTHTHAPLDDREGKRPRLEHAVAATGT